MLKIFSMMKRDARRPADAGEVPVWVRDPLAHPDIAAMDERALGDLPLRPFAAAGENRERCGAD